MGGATAVVTLLRPEDRYRVRQETEDQQYHVLYNCSFTTQQSEEVKLNEVE